MARARLWPLWLTSLAFHWNVKISQLSVRPTLLSGRFLRRALSRFETPLDNQIWPKRTVLDDSLKKKLPQGTLNWRRISEIWNFFFWLSDALICKEATVCSASSSQPIDPLESIGLTIRIPKVKNTEIDFENLKIQISFLRLFFVFFAV